jgi:FKBP-type peptidyl-prolyl cis-trans isomerase (trigger factor)
VGIPVYLFIRNPSVLIVAKVENSYITRHELNQVLANAYGTQALEDLAYKRLADMEFKKKNIVVSEDEMNAKILEIEQSLGGMSLDEALSSSGMTREDLESNIRLQVSLEKLLSDTIVVTSEEIAAYVTENAEQLGELSDEEKNEYASEQLKQQKLQVEMGKWFEELRQNANIKFYL